MTKNLNDSIPQLNLSSFRFFHQGEEENYAAVRPIVTREQKSHRFYFILGAEDPEMSEIKKILRENSEVYRYAKRGGERVSPWDAYGADTVTIPSGATAVLVECEPKNFKGRTDVMRIDHHHKKDPGYDLTHERFWEASSVGQLYKLLNSARPQTKQIVPRHEHFLLAAMDHCFPQAMLGNCPGIDPEEVKKLNIEYTAERRGLDIHAVIAHVRRMKDSIVHSPFITIGNEKVLDLTDIPLAPGYSLDYICLQQAIVELGLIALIKTRNTEQDQPKIILYGAALPETVVSFMTSYAPALGLMNIYGVPSRGHAGGYCH